MQNFCPEVSKFGRFVEADDFYPTRFRTNAGIGGENAVDVGPDFDLVCSQASAEDSGGKIGTAAADRCCDAGTVGADESAHHRHLSRLDEWQNLFLKAEIRFLVLRDGLHVRAVGDQHIAGVDVGAL